MLVKEKNPASKESFFAVKIVRTFNKEIEIAVFYYASFIYFNLGKKRILIAERIESSKHLSSCTSIGFGYA